MTDLPLTPGCNVILRNGDLRGPLKPSPQVDRLWLDPNGFMWDQDGTLWGFQPGGNMDIAEVVG
jgi:hypothetical protein